MRHESRSAALAIDRIPRGTSSLKADILRVNAASAAVKVELFAKEFGVPLNVELTQERYTKLQLKAGDTVFVFPQRVRVFVEDFQI